MSTKADHHHGTWHGLAWLGWALAAVVSIQIASSPLYLTLAVALAAVVVRTIAPDRTKAKMFAVLLIWAGAFAAVRVALSALTVHGEEHVVFTTPSFELPWILGGFRIGGPVDALTLADAAAQALAIVAMVTIFAAFNAVAPHRDLLESLPRSFFEVGVALAVALAFLPTMTRTISDAREADLARTGGRAVRRRRLQRILMPVLESGLERAVLLSESMDSRGFARRGATRKEAIAGWAGALALLCVGAALVALVARSRTAAVALLAGGVAGIVLALRLSAAGAPSRYKSRRIEKADLLMIGVSLAAPAGAWIAALSGDSSLTWPAGRLEFPAISPLPLIGFMALLAPIVLRPPDPVRYVPLRDGAARRANAPFASSAESVRFKGVDFWFPGGNRALSHIGLDIGPGESVLVIGNSGSGKSSLLRAVNGTIPHSTGGRFCGEVLVGGISTRTRKPRDLAGVVGFVHQDPEACFVVDEIEGDLAFGMQNLGYGSREIRQGIAEVAERFGITRLLHRTPSSLSGGEKQRCAIAAAVASGPAVLVLDEPTSQLDPEGAEAVFECIEALAADRGVTVIVAEHRLERASPSATRTVLMEGGFVADVGDAHDVIPGYDGAPEVTALGRLFGWDPPPLTVQEAKALAIDALPHRLPSLNGGGDRTAAPSSGDVLVEARGVSVAFGRDPAIWDVEFDLAAGEVVALLGKNGSGKTTLLRCLAGLLAPDAGLITRRVPVAYVPQDPGALLFAPTVRDEVFATLELTGNADATSSGVIDDWLARVGLAHMEYRHPRSLSGGERQRLAIAAVAVSGAEVLLMDEPTRGIDAASRKALCEFIPAHAREGGAVVLATHDAELAAVVATRVVILDAGEVVADGPPRQALPGTPYEPQVLKVLPPFLTSQEVERSMAVTP